MYDLAMAKGNLELAELFTREWKPDEAAKELKEKRKSYYGVRMFSITTVHVLNNDNSELQCVCFASPRIS